jgi:hypothetical protein
VPEEVRRGAELSVHIFAIRHKDHFQETPVNALHSSLGALFNLKTPTAELMYQFSDEILELREVFRDTFVKTAEKHPRLSVFIHYASRGDTEGINQSVRARLTQTADEVRRLFSASTVLARFLGAADMVELARRQRTLQRRLQFETSLIAERGFVLLVALRDYLQFIKGEGDGLARNLFESNVRDYVGDTGINMEIMATLAGGQKPPDFWWLNNGVTMLASQARLSTPHELVIENPQIVNGLQTTEVIYRYFAQGGECATGDTRAVLIKVIVSSDEDVRDRIIKATNFQNPVALASLRATDVVQRNIEQYLANHGWFYDRRPGYHRNLGRPLERIVSMTFGGAAVGVLAFGNYSRLEKTKWMRNEDQYQQIFAADVPLDVYRVCIEVMRIAAHEVRTNLDREVPLGKNLGRLEAFTARLIVHLRLGKRPTGVDDLVHVSTAPLTKQDLVVRDPIQLTINPPRIRVPRSSRRWSWVERRRERRSARAAGRRRLAASCLDSSMQPRSEAIWTAGGEAGRCSGTWTSGG